MSQTFPALSAIATGTLDNGTGATANPTAAMQPAGTFTLQYNASGNSYTVNDGATARTFAPADQSGSDTAFTYYSQTSGTVGNQLALFTPGSGNSRLQLTYASYGAWETASQGVATTDVTARFFVYGVRTAPSSMPASGSATFTGIVDGAAASNGYTYRLAGSTGTLVANFAAGTVSTSLTLMGNPDVTSTATGSIPLGSLAGTGSIAGGTSGYSGTLAGGGRSGTFTGAFFGPGAAETGYSFATGGGGNTAAGVFVGKR